MQFQNAVGLNTISHDQFEEIHFATLEVLDRVGVNVFDEEALKLLKDAGARVNGHLVHIPAWMVQDALASAPCRVPICNRNGERAMFLEKGRSYYGTGSDTPYTVDIYTGERRIATKQDVVNSAIISDCLSNVDFIMSLALASDVPTIDSYIHQFEAMVLNSTKPIVYTAENRRDLEIIVKMAETIAGGAEELAANPFIILYDEPSSPLQHSEDAVQKFLYLAEKRLPVIYIPAVMMGATGPVTAAGAIVVANSETLSGLVIHQLKAKGAPFIYGGGVPPLDMRTSICSYAAPEEHLNCATMVRMAQYYNLPVFTTAGCSDSQLFDQQAGMEAGFNLLASTLAGGNLIHDLGYIGAGMTSSMEMLVLCNETVGMAKHFLRGIEITPETLALDVIAAVGPGGNYFTEKHTFANFKNHLWFPELLNRHAYDNWNQAGALTFEQKANQKVQHILQNHVPKPLPEAVVNAVQALSAGK
jgi:trimethylamine--corrinoid protein Co-methyltransferase